MAVPGVRQMLATLSRLAGGRRPKFKNAEIDYTVKGETIHVKRFNLSDGTKEIRTHGTVTIYRDMDLVVYPQVDKLIDLPAFLNLPVLSTITNLFHKTVLEIRLGGTIDDPQNRTNLLPLKGKAKRRFVESRHAGRAERIRPKLLP